MQTKILIPEDRFQRANVYWGNFYRGMLLSSATLRYLFKGEYDQSNPFIERYFTRIKQRQKGPLAAEEVRDMIATQDLEEETVEGRSKEMDVTTTLDAERAAKLLPRYQFAFLLQEFLKSRPDIRSVANVGARVDFYSAYLARQFPNVEFHSVDFQSKLKEHNRLLPQSPNWTFDGGDYPLNTIQSGRVKCDMYFFVSAASIINNKEFNAYLEAMSHAKALAFCESWWQKVDSLSHSPKIILPEDVSRERPYCSGAYATYHHNYVRKLEDRGFRIHLSQITPENEAFHYLQVIGAKPT